MNCSTVLIRKKIHVFPCLPALFVVVCCVLSQTESVFFLVPAMAVGSVLCFIKAWRLFLLCLLLGLCAWGVTKRSLSDDGKTASLYGCRDEVVIETSGSVLRSFARSVWMQCESPSMIAEMIVPEGEVMQIGERWRFRATASEIPAPASPGGFDRKQWLARHHVVVRLKVIEASRLGGGGIKSRLLAASASWRKKIESILAEGSEQGDVRTGVMASLLLGEKQAMEPDILRMFKEGGCLHIFAVSGLHVGFAAGIFLFLCSFLRLHPITTRLLTLVPLAAYVFVTGMPVSAMRAFVMVCLFFAGTAMRRKTRSINLLALAAIGFLLAEPFQLYDAGFLLSFLIFAVVVIAGAWEAQRPPGGAPIR